MKKRSVGLLTFLLLLTLSVGWVFCQSTSAQDYVYSKDRTVLYERYTVPYTYYYCNRPYTAYKYQYKQVVNYTKADWRQQALTLIDKQKERESFNQTLSYLGAQNIMAPAPYANSYAPQQALLQPSATGNTVGGFTSYEYQRYGSTAALDTNKALERTSLLIDNYDRTTADTTRQNNEIRAGVGGLIQMNSTQVGNAIELQETRAALKEATGTVQQMFAGLSQFVASAKPKDSEYLRYESGGVSGHTGGPTGTPSPEQPFQSSAQPQPPQGGGPPSVDLGALNAKFCADCHGPNVKEPSGGFIFDPSDQHRLDTTVLGALAMRLDYEAPDYRQDGKRYFRMPPVTYRNQPSIEERRALVVGTKQYVELP